MNQLQVSALISNVEFKRSQPTLPGLNSKGLVILLLFSALFFGLGLYLFKDRIDHPLTLLSSGTVLIWSISCILSFINMLAFPNVPYREWWFTLPHPRQMLTHAKLLLILRIMSRMTVPITIACVGYYYVALNRWEMAPVIFPEFFFIAMAYVLLAIIGTPVAVTLGMLVSTLHEGKIRWVYIVPYFIVIFSSFSFVFIVQLIDVQFLTASNLLLCVIAVLVVGWPLTYLLLRYITHAGMRSMANMSLISGRLLQVSKASRADKAKKNNKVALVKNTKQNHWLTLYQFERTRYIHLSSLPLVRVVLLTIFILVGVGAYMSAGKVGGVLVLVLFLITLPLIVPVFWAMMVHLTEGQNKRTDWWLLFPYSRTQLLFMRLMAIWMTALRIVTWMSVVFWTVTLFAIMTRGLESKQLSLSFEWFLYGIVLYIAALLISSGTVQLIAITSRSMLHTILVFPLIFFVFNQSAIWINYWLPEELGEVNIPPDWSLLLLLLGIGIPFAIVGIIVGARHLNFHMSQFHNTTKLFKGN